MDSYLYFHSKYLDVMLIQTIFATFTLAVGFSQSEPRGTFADGKEGNRSFM